MDLDARFFLAMLLSFSRREDLLHTMAKHYGSAEETRERVASGVAQLMGGDCDRRAISAEAARAMLDRIAVEAFSNWAAQRWNRLLPDQEASALTRYYAQVMEHAWLTPLVS